MPLWGFPRDCSESRRWHWTMTWLMSLLWVHSVLWGHLSRSHPRDSLIRSCNPAIWWWLLEILITAPNINQCSINSSVPHCHYIVSPWPRIWRAVCLWTAAIRALDETDNLECFLTWNSRGCHWNHSWCQSKGWMPNALLTIIKSDKHYAVWVHQHFVTEDWIIWLFNTSCLVSNWSLDGVRLVKICDAFMFIV